MECRACDLQYIRPAFGGTGPTVGACHAKSVGTDLAVASSRILRNGAYHAESVETSFAVDIEEPE